VINNRVKFVELLLERKADINELFKGESMLERALKSNNVHISACLVLAGATLDSTDLDRYNGLLSLNGYDQYEGTLSLNALVCRKINPHFHRCKSIEEIDALASKINLPPGLISPFYKGLESGTAKEE
jgi:ankyrin repeat protein